MITKKFFFITIACVVSLTLKSSFIWSQPADSGTPFFSLQDIQTLLNLNTDEIRLTWAEFQQLLTQTGNPVNIAFQAQDGMITISRAQFQQILSNMKSVSGIHALPPNDYVITEAAYTGIAGEKNSRFSAAFKLYVFEQDRPAYVVIPLIHTSLALRDMRIDGAPAAIVTNGDWHCITLSQPGYHDVTAIFSAEQGNYAVALPVVRAIGNRLDFTVANHDGEISATPTITKTIEQMSDGLRFSGYAPPTDALRIAWFRKSAEQVKRPAMFYAATRTLLAVDADILRGKTEVGLEIIQGSLNQISLIVPQQYEVVQIDGEAVSEWHVRKTDLGQVLDILFQYDITRTVNVTVYAERILSADTLAADFSGFQVLDARRETGYIGVIAESAIEVQAQGAQNAQAVEYHKLPPEILSMSARPVLFAFQYANHPYQLDISITKHERMEGITTVIESADATALFLKEGKILYRVVYTVRNTLKQFMALTLPPNASIWTVYVDNQRAKASRNQAGNVLISLVRSSGDGVKPFPVEVIYTLPGEAFGVRGAKTCQLPIVDIFTNKTRLALYLPSDFRYDVDEEDWEAIESAPMTTISDETTVQTGEDIFPAGRMRPTTEEPLTGAEMPSEAERAPQQPQDRIDFKADRPYFGQAMTGPVGLSSINIYLPLSGEHLLFEKDIVDKGEAFPLRFSYSHQRLRQGILLSLLVIAGIGVVSFFLKRRTPVTT